MFIRLFDKFDRNFTVAKFGNVESVESVGSDGTIYFEVGDYSQYDKEFLDWECIDDELENTYEYFMQKNFNISMKRKDMYYD